MSIKKLVFASLVVALIALFAIGLGTAPAAHAGATTVKSNTTIPIGGVVFNPCAGESVAFRGRLHVVFHATVDADGGFHIVGHANTQGVKGIGLTSRDSYQVIGVSNFNLNVQPPFPVEATVVTNFSLVSKGSADNLHFHLNLHVTVNAQGDVTATVGNININCTG